MGLEVIHEDLAAHGAGLFGFGANIVHGLRLSHIFGRGSRFEEHHGDVLGHCLVQDNAGSGAIHGVNCQRVYALGEEQVNLIVLSRLIVLAVNGFRQPLRPCGGFNGDTNAPS